MCLSADSKLQMIKECVSMLTLMSDHQTLAQKLCSQHGEVLSVVYKYPYTNEKIYFVSLYLLTATEVLIFLLCFVFFRPLCFPQVIPLHQNQTRQPRNTHRVDSAGPAGNTHCRDIF